jgi:dsDNA-specific endonuclease/ATPase MutS2
MERNKWETAIRCLEVAVHPHTTDDEAIAAINGFRRTVEGTPLSQVCIEFACGGLPLSELAGIKATLEQLNRENLELRRKLAVDEAAQAATARRLDSAYERIHQLNEELLAARRHADAAEAEFAQFRADYSQLMDSASHDNRDLRLALDEARRAAAGRRAEHAAPSFARFLAEARMEINRVASPLNGPLNGTGSGRLQPAEPNPDHPWTA